MAEPAVRQVRVGGLDVPWVTARELVDGDLLAPLLLNAGPTIRGFAGLQQHASELEVALARIPLDADLADADDALIDLLVPLFAVLDSPGIPDVRGTILAKVLHRKRPAFIPLFDRWIARCY